MTATTLAKLPVGASARVTDVRGEAVLEQRLLEMGLIPGTTVTLVRIAPLGDPMEFRVLGYSLSLRRNEAAAVAIEVLP
jgi:Fe2+ transport system protein FeoA